MSTPLSFKDSSSGGNYGTHRHAQSAGSAYNTARRRTAPGSDVTAGIGSVGGMSSIHNNYGPFSSPHGSFDDPSVAAAAHAADAPFPPYAELPFTALKRRRQLEQNNSFVRWAMRGVLLSPVIVLVLWSVVALVFANPQSGGNGNGSHNNSNANGNGVNSNHRQSSWARRSGMMRRNVMSPSMGAATTTTASSLSSSSSGGQGQVMLNPAVYAQTNGGSGGGGGGVMGMMPQQQMQPGNMVMMTAPQQQQYQMQQQPQQQQQGMMMSSTSTLQGGQAGVGEPLLMATNGATSGINAGQQQLYPDQQLFMAVQPQYMAVQQQQQLQQQQQQKKRHIPVIGPLGSTSNGQMNGSGAGMQQQQQFFVQQPVAGIAQESGYLQQQQPAMQQQGQQQQSGQSQEDGATAVVHANAMQQQGTSFSTGSTAGVDVTSIMQEQPKQQKASPAKQAIYYYDPKQAVTTQNGEMIQLPSIVYNEHGKAIPLSELRHAQSVPIYVQPPYMGATNTGTAVSSITDMDISTEQVLLDSAAGTLQQAAPSRGATSSALSRMRPRAWGASSSQDQTIIVATVAVMALLVGALSARRLRSKSFLASCIENETLEDDLAYDSAYTTTGGMGGGGGSTGGADSSYNTFGGGWKGDLEKFDV